MSDTPEGCLDMVGQPLHTGDFIVVPHKEYRQLQIAEITGWTPKKMKVRYLINAGFSTEGRLDISSDKYVKIDPSSVTYAQLKQAK